MAMFWDGSRWVDQRPAPRAPRPFRPKRLRDWLATAAMLLVVGAFVVPFTGVLGRGPEVTVSPSYGTPGQIVQVRGSGLAPRAVVELLWDGASIGVAGLGTNGGGSFRAQMIVPPSAAPGAHAIGARIQGASSTPGSKNSSPITQTVSATFTVSDAAAGPTTAPATTAPDPTAAPRTASPTAQPPAVVTPPPTARPTATPVPATPVPPTPPPAPDPTPKPTAPPPDPTQPPPSTNCDRTLHDGSGDRTSDLLNLIGSAPNGATICFDAGAYVVNGQIKISNRTGLTFVGPATIKSTTTDRGNKSLFQVNNSNDIVFRDLTLLGGRPDPGTYYPYHEYEIAIAFHASSGTVNSVTMRNFGGDGVYAGAFGDSPTLSHDITVKNSIIDGTGRMGIALTAATRVVINNNSFDNVALTVIDLEPNSTTYETSNVTVSNNTVHQWGLDPTLRPWFFEADTGRAHDLTIRDNTFVGSALTVDIGRWMNVNRSNVTITGNTSNIAGKSPFGSGNALLYLWHINGLIVRNNDQALASGHSFASVSDCTNVSTPIS